MIYVLTLKEQTEKGCRWVLGVFTDQNVAWESKILYEEYFRTIPNKNFQVDMEYHKTHSIQDTIRKIESEKELDQEIGYLK